MVDCRSAGEELFLFDPTFTSSWKPPRPWTWPFRAAVDLSVVFLEQGRSEKEETHLLATVLPLLPELPRGLLDLGGEAGLGGVS